MSIPVTLNPVPTGNIVVIDSISTCEAHDPNCAPRYHWIEEGTYEDFRRNILESDLPVPFDFPSWIEEGNMNFAFPLDFKFEQVELKALLQSAHDED